MLSALPRTSLNQTFIESCYYQSTRFPMTAERRRLASGIGDSISIPYFPELAQAVSENDGARRSSSKMIRSFSLIWHCVFAKLSIVSYAQKEG